MIDDIMSFITKSKKKLYVGFDAIPYEKIDSKTLYQHISTYINIYKQYRLFFTIE